MRPATVRYKDEVRVHLSMGQEINEAGFSLKAGEKNVQSVLCYYWVVLQVLTERVPCVF